MNAPKDELLQAVELALTGKWYAAHEIVSNTKMTPRPRGFTPGCT